MAHYDSFDICEAYWVMEADWNRGGWLQERPSNRRRKEATHVQLARVRFKPHSNLDYESLTDNGKEIYADLCAKYGFEFPEDYTAPGEDNG